MPSLAWISAAAWARAPLPAPSPATARLPPGGSAPAIVRSRRRDGSLPVPSPVSAMPRSRPTAGEVIPMIAVSGTQTSALVFTLLTFCPPGPRLRAYWKRKADSLTVTPGAKSIASAGGAGGGNGGIASLIASLVLCLEARIRFSADRDPVSRRTARKRARLTDKECCARGNRLDLQRGHVPPLVGRVPVC